MTKVKGMLVFVYRSPLGDCTANGITSKVTQIVMVGKGLPEIFEVEEGEPYLKLTNYNDSFRAEVVSEETKGKHSMFGGNFVYTSDSRFSAITKYPVPVHDRFE